MKDMTSVTLGNLLSVSEAAERLGLDEDSITRYCRLGEIRATKKGKMWLIDEESFDRFARIPRQAGNPNFRRKDHAEN